MKGYSYLWLLIIIIIGAFFFAGGQFINEDLNNLGVQLSPTPTPLPIGAIGNVTATPTGGSPGWSLFTVATCTGSNNQTHAVFTVTAPTYPSFLVIQYKDNEGVFQTDPFFNTTITSAAENDPTKTLNFAYAAREWQGILYDVSGTKRAETGIKPPTNCP